MKHKNKKPEKDKDWEVLSVKSEYGWLSIRMENGYFLCYSDSTPQWYSLNDVINDGCKIYSIRRISDGEVFNVGDEVEYEGLIEPIAEFNINDFDKLMWVKAYRDKISGGVFNCPINLLSKPKDKERIEVTKVYYLHDHDKIEGGGVYGFETTRQFNSEKFPLIKQAIEQVFNDEEGIL